MMVPADSPSPLIDDPTWHAPSDALVAAPSRRELLGWATRCVAGAILWDSAPASAAPETATSAAPGGAGKAATVAPEDPASRSAGDAGTPANTFGTRNDSVSPDTGDEALRQATLAVWSRRGDPASFHELLRSLERWKSAYPKDARPHALEARALYWYVHLNDVGNGRDAQLKLLWRGVESGRQAAQLDPRLASGHFWGTTCLGVYSQLKGIMESVSSLKDIRRGLEKVETLDPNHFYGGIWRYYGRLIDQVPSSLRLLNGYDLDDALAFHRKAVSLEPRYIQSYVYLAECLVQDDQQDAAITCLRLGEAVALESLPDVMPENRLFKTQATRLRSRLEAG